MFRRLAVSAFVFLGVAGALSAQWATHPTAGAPRTSDGKVDMNGPAPKTADGKPDLSGLWDSGRVPMAQGAGRGPAGPPPGPPPAGGPGGGPGGRGPAGPRPFQNLPSLFPDGLPMQPWAASLRAERLANNSKDHPDAHCLPLSPVQLHTHPQPRKIVQTPSVTMIVYEANNGLRQLFTDGRALPKPADVQPWWFGYSTAKWDGDALVAETVGFRELGWLDEEGTPFTDSAKLTERFRRPNYGTLEIEITVDDPKTFTKPWSFKLNQRLLADSELIEFVCGENNTNIPHLVGKQ